jgi:hypothetical protein
MMEFLGRAKRGFAPPWADQARFRRLRKTLRGKDGVAFQARSSNQLRRRSIALAVDARAARAGVGRRTTVPTWLHH